MEIPSDWVTCDGCGLPASPAHIAERLARLEFATRYRPIHVSVLFIAAAPSPRSEDDFYRPPESREFFDSFMEALEIPAAGKGTREDSNRPADDSARLSEFQRRGYYLSYLSECPLTGKDDSVTAAISRRSSTLVRRIRFNYRPKQIAVLGNDFTPLRDVLEKGGIPANSIHILEIPRTRDSAGAARFRAALANLVPRDNLASDYDRIQLKQP